MAEENCQVQISKDDMLKMFGLSRGYTHDELKRAYKRLVIAHHPDKTLDIRSTPTFQLITSCFKALYNDLMIRTQQKEFMELKGEFEKNKDKFKYTDTLKRETEAKVRDGASRGTSNGKFNLKLFNELFAKSKIKDAYDDGYDKWQKDERSMKERNNNTIVKYVEPKPIVSSLGKAQFYELGAGTVKDFSTENVLGGFAFTDLRLAHTTERLINEDQVKKRKEYRNVEQLERDRANMPVEMSEEELKKYMKNKLRQEELEKQRMYRLSSLDNKISKMYEQNHLLIAERLRR